MARLGSVAGGGRLCRVPQPWGWRLWSGHGGPCLLCLGDSWTEPVNWVPAWALLWWGAACISKLRTSGSGSPLGGRTQAVSWALGKGWRSHLLLFSGALHCQGGWGSDYKPDAWSRPWAWPFLVFIIKLGKDACGPSEPQGDSLQRDKLGGPSKHPFLPWIPWRICS